MCVFFGIFERIGLYQLFAIFVYLKMHVYGNQSKIAIFAA